MTWLTEPGVIMRDPLADTSLTENPTTCTFSYDFLFLVQRRVSGLMVSVKNNRSEYVIVHLFSRTNE